MLGVAKLMRKYAKKLNLDEHEMFVLGLLHDIGYEFGDNSNHNEIAFNILNKNNYKYAYEILYHGIADTQYSSPELDLLNYADMHIDTQGNYVSFDNRLQDIKSRRGETSPAYINALKVVALLTDKNFLI